MLGPVTSRISSLRLFAIVFTIASFSFGLFVVPQQIVVAQTQDSSFFTTLINMFGADLAKNAWSKVFGGVPSTSQVAQVAGSGKTLYVNNSGSVTCSDNTTYANNSANLPWCTIGRAAWGSTNRDNPNANEAARAGDTVMISAGTYNTTATGIRYDPVYNPVNSGTASAPITFQADGRVVLTQSGYGPLIGANGIFRATNYIIWKGFTIHEINALATSDTGPVVFFSTTGSRLEDSEINGFDNGRLGNNHNGVRLENTDGVVIRNNKIYNVLNYGSYHHNGAGIMTYTARNTLVEHNEIYNCGASIFFKGGDNENNIVRYNYVYDSTGNGKGIMVGAQRGSNNRIYQNVVHTNGRGITLHPVVDVALTGQYYILNNTIVETTPGGEAGGIHFNYRLSSTANFLLQNNIIYQPTNASPINAPYWDDPSYIQADYNVYYEVGNWIMNGREYRTLSEWQTLLGGCPGTGNDCNSISSNPLFVNHAGRDYRLQSGSPARTAGRDILNLSGQGTNATIPAGAYITGSEVIGVDFDSTSNEPAPEPEPQPEPTPTVTFSASPTSITSGQTSTLSWSSTDATTCTASGAWSGTKSTSGTQSVSPTNTATYTINCSGDGGSVSRSVSITVTQPPQEEPVPTPTVRLSASPTSITSGQSSTLSWSSTDATTCTASGAWSGTKSTSGTQSVSPTNTATYAISCTGAGGSASQSVTITVSAVAAPAPTVTLTASPQTITSGKSATLQWSSTNTTSCAASGAWTGLKSVTGSMSVSPTATSKYTLACTGAGGTVGTSVTVTVDPVEDTPSDDTTTPTETTETVRVKKNPKTTDTSWVHTIETENDATSESYEIAYLDPYFTYRGITAVLMKAYQSGGMTILVAGSGSRYQKINKEGSLYKNGTWHTIQYTGMWPESKDGTYVGKAYYILRPTDPLYTTDGAFTAHIQMNLPGCDNSTCTIDGTVLQEFRF